MTESFQFAFQTRTLDGAIIEQATERHPATFQPEDQQLCSIVRNRLTEMSPGTKSDFILRSEELYGTRHNRLRCWWPKSLLPASLQLGDQVELQTPGATVVGWVQQFSGDRVLIDANHPLAEDLVEIQLHRLS